MTGKRGNIDTGGKQTPSADAFTADPRIRALVRYLARRAAEADYAELLKAQGKSRHNSGERTRS